MSFRLTDELARDGYTLRAACDSDRPFQRALFATARSDAALLALWPASQREPFLDQQFGFQDTHYRNYYPTAEFLILERHGEPIGRLVLDRGATDWQVVDIALVPQSRGRGAGAAVLRALQDGVVAAGASTLSLSVELGNIGARRLYTRLGFVEVPDADLDTHIPMVWTSS